jgi:geranylgeranyl pyrophosphate synthase
MTLSNIDFDSISRDYSIKRIASNIIDEISLYCKENNLSDEIRDLLTYNLSLGGRRIRLIKSLVVAKLTGGITEDIENLICALEFANSAIFIHDDIIDHDTKRKERPTLNSMIGYEKALLIGNILHALSIAKLLELSSSAKKKRIDLDLIKSLIVEHLGQFSDLDYRHNYPNSLEKWEEMVLRHSCNYVAFALAGIAKLNRADSSIIDALYEYEKNCTLAGAAEDALLGFYGKKSSGDLKNGSYTILVYFALKEKGNINDSPEALAKSIADSSAVFSTKEYIQEKVTRALDSIKCFKEGREKSILIFLTKQILENAK